MAAARSAGSLADSGSGGPLARAQAQATLAAMGAPSDLRSPGAIKSLQGMATDAAVAAGAATGIDIRDPSALGGIDPVKARAAVSRVLGIPVEAFAVGGGRKPSVRRRIDRATSEALKAAVATAAELRIDLLRPDGSIDPARARGVIDVGLAASMPARRPTRAESTAALDRALGVVRAHAAGDRRSALQALDALRPARPG